MSHMEIWNKLCRPPEGALKRIKGGRLNGMTDINPQWRYEAMTEHFGPVGVGWKFSVDRLWLEDKVMDEVCAFAQITLYIKHDGAWSDGIPGIGGSKLATAETRGVHVSDECYKMAVTDALSTAMKVLGVGADIYAGRYDGSKYTCPPPEQQPAQDNQLYDQAWELFDSMKEGLNADWRNWAQDCMNKNLFQEVIDKLTEIKEKSNNGK
jgi:hypothetical protein